MHRFFREPLLHFTILGALLFALYGWLNRGALDAPDEIVVSSGQLDSMNTQFERAWQRPPTTEELKGLTEAWVREEVLYREGLAMGLERDDPLVRRRIAQKVEFIADGQASAAPTDAELQTWLETHPDDYRVEPKYTLRQVYFDPVRHGDRIDAVLAAARTALEAGATVDGDSTMLPAVLDAVPAFEVERVFGPEFAEALTALPVGGWQEPVPSGYGMHLVQLSARDGGRLPKLAEVRPAVERDLISARTAEANAAFYRNLRDRYTVRIEAAPDRARGGGASAVGAQ